tara:strand:+ start:103 stop:858 length:756 start_codon:yes stop_codon:yes gene_type:complete
MISIIITSFNSSETISTTLDSLLNQSSDKFECVFVDGGSSDGTAEILKNYLLRFESRGIRTKLVSEPDNGIYDAWNKGLKLASGQFVAFLNSDDWYDIGVIEKVAKITSVSSDIRVVAGILMMTSIEGKSLGTRKHKYVKFKSVYQMPLLFPALFVHKSLYEKSNGFDNSFRLSGDYNFVMSTYPYWKNSILIDDDVKVFMRRGGITSSIKYIRIGLIEDFKILLKHRPYSALIAILGKALIKSIIVIRNK